MSCDLTYVRGPEQVNQQEHSTEDIRGRVWLLRWWKTTRLPYFHSVAVIKHSEGRRVYFNYRSREVRVGRTLTARHITSTVNSQEKQMCPCCLFSPSLLGSYAVQDSLSRECCSPLDGLLPHQVIIETIPYRQFPKPIWPRQSLCWDPISADSKLCQGDIWH